MEITLEVVGDSHIARMEAAGVRWPFKRCTSFLSRGGGGVSHPKRFVARIVGRPPHLIADVPLLFLGGNDVDRNLEFLKTLKV